MRSVHVKAIKKGSAGHNSQTLTYVCRSMHVQRTSYVVDWHEINSPGMSRAHVKVLRIDK